MHRIDLTYQLGADSDAAPATIGNALMDLLFAVRQHGSISAAAKALGLSYRHVWGELKKWEQTLGRTLIVWDKGQPARLNEFGEKLLWAERQAQARLAPQINALRADLERAFAVAFDDAAHVVPLYASHDDALGALRDHAVSSAKLYLDIRYTGSVDAIRGLNEGRCVIAGFHTRNDPVPGSLTERIYKPLLKPGMHKIIGFAQRSQGLIVARGNPLGLRTLADLLRPGTRYVNRALGTGTRVLFDELLEQAGLASADVAGYARTEPSHTAVAHAIAAGTADAGLGIESAARQHHLDFLPLVQESYFLVCLKSTLDLPSTRALLDVLRSAAWQAALARMPGYAPAQSGQVLSLRRVLPWWSFPPKPPARGGRGGPR
ncbi:substrate-binding domain-containing protein [Bordetella genomosp. 7]|uniref:LysR family transcriptional regulator n=1 Tax=Bordetella genomosp. 7 TaxID=1416805 RepID=A0A261QUF8_9BORD|nr:substrate-binding domain-containing protein [Bordetella genomosp. 7]OZI16394.1 LysR family transcriptional regulator [Bordetella genomosp. 7]